MGRSGTKRRSWGGWILGFRYYDPAIGRFPSVDPIADQFAFVSPFNYAENEPVGHIDLWGLQKAKKDDDPSNDHDRARDEALDRLPFMSMTGVSPDNISNEYEGQVVQESWKWARMNQAIWKFIVEVAGSANFNINGWAGTTVVGQASKSKGFLGKIGGFFKGIFGGKGRGISSGSKASANIPKDSGIGLKGFSMPQMTTTDGFLFRSFTIRTPVNIPAQRFGNMSLSRPDFWGLRIGTNKFANRTFAAIKPEWNPLTQYTSGIIPKGTTIKFGIIGPQGWRYPGGSLQFILPSQNVINQSSKLIPR